MPFSFRMRIKLRPGMYLNLGKRSASVTVKKGRVSQNRSTTGRRRTSVNLPGPVDWYTTSTPSSRRRRRPRG